jgi:DNA-directed RNA polymerase specialized sigma24 family protein
MVQVSRTPGSRPRPLQQAVVAAAARARSAGSGPREHHALAASVRALAFDTARRLTSPFDADDVANDVTLKCLAAFREGRVGEGSEATYVRRAAHHRVCSGYRAQRRFVPVDVAGMDAGEASGAAASFVEASSPTPLESLAEDASRRGHEAALDALERLVETAPSPHREVLSGHLAGLCTKELVARELASRRAAGTVAEADARAESRLRAALDQRFCRAKGWVRKQWAEPAWADVA